jgi:putative ABC transport system permease protein
MLKDFFLFSLNNLKSRRLRSWLTMIGIFIGIAAVVALIGLGEGLRAAINAQFGFLGGDVIAITATGGLGPPGTGVVNPLTDKELKAVQSVPGIKVAAGRIIESGKIVYNHKVAFGYAASIPDGEGRKLMEHIFNLKVEKGRALVDGDSGVVFLGYNFMKDDNVFGKAILPGAKIQIQDKEFTVIGIMEKKGNFQVDNIVLLNEDDLRALVNRPGNDYDIIGAQFDEGADVAKIKSEIEKRLRKIRGVKEGEEDFTVQTPDQVLDTVNSTLLAVQIFIYIIASISVLVGGIGIMNTMYTAVVERTKEIGIMKSIGARNSAIFTLFFIESGFLGSVGGAIGIIIGYSIAKGLAYVGRLVLGSDLISAHIPWWLVFGAFCFSFLIGSFFGTLPAYRASKLRPVDALRYSK